MSLIMSGVDYKTANIPVREMFSLTTSGLSEILYKIKQQPLVCECSLISTCNRTELYIVTPDSEPLSPAEILCGALGLDYEQLKHSFTTRIGHTALRHLMMVAAGLRSQMRGEDQILAQVKDAALIARECGSAGAELETLFRCAVSAAKKAKTLAPIAPLESSVSDRAISALKNSMNGLSGRKVLVIGNGIIGKLTASRLAAEGCDVTVTIRSYHRGAAVPPNGCSAIPYEDRYALMDQCDIVISATTSPHHTITAGRLAELDKLPSYFIDLAVPRDIDPEIVHMPGTILWNVDTLGGEQLSSQSAGQLLCVKRIIDEYTDKYYKWLAYRNQLHSHKV